MISNDNLMRKEQPMAQGLLDYFPDALAAVSHVSVVGARQHDAYKPDGSIMWKKHLSTDHADCIIRHLADRGTNDKDGLAHSAKVAWRALALLQIEIEAAERNKALGDAMAAADKAFDDNYAGKLQPNGAYGGVVGVDPAKPGSDRTAIHVFGGNGISPKSIAQLFGVRAEDIIMEDPLPPPDAPGVADVPVAVSDFGMWLTTREKCVHAGAKHEVYDMIEAMEEYALLLRKRAGMR